MAQLASLAGDEASAASYGHQANATAQAINQLLFNATTGSYAVSLTDGNYSYIDSESQNSIAHSLTDAKLTVAMSVIAGVSSGNRTTSQLAKLDNLRFGPAYVQDSSVVGTNETTLSTYLSGYLLEALGISCRSEEMRFLLDNLWTLMAQPGDDYSGGSWEYVVRTCGSLKN